MKSFNVLNLLVLLLPLSGCASRPDYTLNPPASTEWVTVTVKLPPQTEIPPMGVLYRSVKCQREDYDSTTESHIRKERGFNPQRTRMILQGGSDIWQSRIALDGGGKCEWKLSAIRVDIQPISAIPLAVGKKIIPTSYVFNFDDGAYGGGEGSGRKKDIHGDLNLKTELFPMIIHHRDGEVTLNLFGGNTDKKKLSRHYRVFNTKNIVLEPKVHFAKEVVLTPPVSLPGDIIATYPDGSQEKIEHVYPDYEKLLLMK